MSGTSQARRAVVEILTADGRARIPTVGNRSIHHYWQALAPYFSEVLLAPQRRSDDRGMIWTWKAPAETRPPTESALAALRSRLTAAAARFEEENAATAPGATGPRAHTKELRAGVKKFVGKLAAESDTRLAAYVGVTETGPMIHSWGAAEPGRPYFPDALECEVRGAVIVGEKDAAGIEVVLENRKGDCVARTKSDQTGAFCFQKIGAGSYRIRAISGRINFPVSGQEVIVEHDSVTGLKLLSTSLNIANQQAAAAVDAPRAAPVRTSPSRPRAPVSAPRRWRWLAAAAALLLIAAAGGWWVWRGTPPADSPPRLVTSVSPVGSVAGGAGPDSGGGGSAARYSSVTTSSGTTGAPAWSDSTHRAGDRGSLQSEAVRREAEILSGTPAVAEAGSREAAGRKPGKSGPPREKSLSPADHADGKTTGPETTPDNDGDSASTRAAAKAAVGKKLATKPARNPSKQASREGPKPTGRADEEEAPSTTAPVAAEGAQDSDAAGRKKNPTQAKAGSGKKKAGGGDSAEAEGGGEANASETGSTDQNEAPGGAAAGQAGAQRAPKRAGAPGAGKIGAAAPAVAESPATSADAEAGDGENADASSPPGAAAKRKNAGRRAGDGRGEAASGGEAAAGESDATPDDQASSDPASAAKAAAKPAAKSTAPKKKPSAAAPGAASAAADDSRTDEAKEAPVAGSRAQRSGSRTKQTPAPDPGDATGDEAAPEASTPARDGAADETDAKNQVMVRVQASAWKTRLVQDMILPTQPVAEGDGESVAALRDRLLKEQAALMPQTLRHPAIWRGFAVELPAGAGPALWRDARGMVPEGATVAEGRAEIGWRAGEQAPAGGYTLVDGAGREIARVTTRAGGEMALQSAAGAAGSYWIGIERSPADGGMPGSGERRFDWRLQSGRPLPEGWRQDPQWRGGRGQRIEMPVDAAKNGATGFSLEVADRVTGWAIVSRLGLTSGTVGGDEPETEPQG